MMLISTITLSVLCLASLLYTKRLKNDIAVLEDRANELAMFCHQQTEINQAVVGKVLELEDDLNSAQEITREYTIEEEEGPCPGFGRHKNTKFGDTKEMNIEDHKWS